MTIEFMFDLGSPASYLAWSQLSKLEAVAETKITPILLGGVFKARADLNPTGSRERQAWFHEDFGRWAARYDIPLKFPRNFPINTIAPMRGAAGLVGDPRFRTYVDAIYQAMFGRGEDISDPEVLRAALKGADLDAKPILASMTEQPVKDRLKAMTEDAIARGVFGAPTFFVGNRMFFGNDRIDWVIEAAQE